MDKEAEKREYRKAFVDMFSRGRGILRMEPGGKVEHVPWEDTQQESSSQPTGKPE
jgi:hypothetical protein